MLRLGSSDAPGTAFRRARFVERPAGEHRQIGAGVQSAGGLVSYQRKSGTFCCVRRCLTGLVVGRMDPDSDASATGVEVGDDIQGPSDGLDLVDRPAIERLVGVAQPRARDLPVAFDDGVERPEEPHEQHCELERLRSRCE